MYSYSLVIRVNVFRRWQTSDAFLGEGEGVDAQSETILLILIFKGA